MKCKSALHVGTDTYKSKNGSKLPYTYRHVKPKPNGWIDPEEWMPFPYDLVHVKLQDSIKPAWFTGSKWDGYRLSMGDKVTEWKRIAEDE